MARHNYKLFILTIALFTFINIIIINPVLADNNILDSLQNSGGAAGYSIPQGSSADSFMQTTIGQIISIALGFIGVLFLILIIYSGYQWMTAGGNEETVTKAKKRITEAAIGLIIILAAWLLTFFVLNNLFTAFETQMT